MDGQKLSASVLVRLEDDLNELLEAEAKSRRVSKAFVVRELLRERYKLVPSRPAVIAPVESQEAA